MMNDPMNRQNPPSVTTAFGDDTSRRLMNSQGQQIPQPYHTPTGAYTPPQYYQPVQPYPQQAAPYMPPQYGPPVQPYPQQTAPYMPPQYGPPVQPYPQQTAPYMPPQYGQPMQPYPQQTAPYMPPQYYQTVAVPEEFTREQTFKSLCSRIGLALMAGHGIMFLVQLLTLIIGGIGYLMMRGSFPAELDATTAGVNILMFSMILSSLFGNFIPARAHGSKWKIDFTEPFKGDRLSSGFIGAALVTALGLNAMWCYVYYYARNYLYGLFDRTPPADEIYTPETLSPVGMICMIIAVCVIAPIAEEYFFRGILLRTLSQYSVGFGIVASALLFGFMHGNLGQTPMAFLIGLIMGYVAAKSGGIRQTIVIHMVNNVLATLPEAIQYFCPEWYDLYVNIDFCKDLAFMAFAVFALIYFAVVRRRGLKARRIRLMEGGEFEDAEQRWNALEIPEARRRPIFGYVEHKFLKMLSTGGMVFFFSFMLVAIVLTELLPFLMEQMRFFNFQ